MSYRPLPAVEDMVPVPVFIPQRRCIACPACGKGELTVEHLFTTPAQSFGPWFCRECGVGFAGCADPDGTVRIALTGARRVETRCLVRLSEDVGDLVFEVKHFAIDRPVGSLDEGGQRFWFEEHTCVQNFLHGIAETWADGDRDPHGIFDLLEERLSPTDGSDAFTEEDILRHKRDSVIDVLPVEGSASRALRSVPRDKDPG